MQVLLKSKTKYELLSGESIFPNYPLYFFLNTEVCGVYKNKKQQPFKIFLVEGWIVEGRVTKGI